MKQGTKRILVQAFLFLASGASVAHGKECNGIDFPDHAQVDGSNLTLNGLGLRLATAFNPNYSSAGLFRVGERSLTY